MKISFRFSCSLVLFCLLSMSSRAQDEYRIGILPQLSSKHKLGEIKFTGEVESRQYFYEGSFSEEFSDAAYNFDYLDLSVLFSKGLADNNSVNVGYLLRIREKDEYIHRFMEQFVIKSGGVSIKSEHRFAAEQMYGALQKPEYRFRYRIALQKALTNDPAKATYLKIRNEHLYSFQGKEEQYEIRASALFGFPFSGGDKLEVGPQYRISPVNRSLKTHKFLLYLSYSIDWNS